MMFIRIFGLLVASVLLCSHDMFLKLDSYRVSPDDQVQIRLLNGTFDRSENTIDRDRMTDVRIVHPNGVSYPTYEQWSERDNETILKLTTGDAGTYVAGVSTHSKSIDLKASDFNDYLEHDGILDKLDQRKHRNQLKKDIKELYSKHVKVIFQVGSENTDQYLQPLNYPIEFIPLSNPYAKTVGDRIAFSLLRNGTPLLNQLVYIGQSHQKNHQHEEEHSHDHRSHELSLRTDENGRISHIFDKPGAWYVRTIHMTEHKDPMINYESCWGTLNFEIK